MDVTEAQEVMTGQNTFDKFNEFHLKVRIRPSLRNALERRKFQAFSIAITIKTVMALTAKASSKLAFSRINLPNFKNYSIILFFFRLVINFTLPLDKTTMTLDKIFIEIC